MDFFSSVGGTADVGAAQSVDSFAQAIAHRPSILTARLHPPQLTTTAAALPPSSSTPANPPIPVPPSDLTQWLNDPSTLIVDIRPNAAFAFARLPRALSLSVPSTLLKRPLFSLHRLAAMLPNPIARARFESWKDAARIIVYDADSQGPLSDSSNLYGLLRKFGNEGFTGDLAWVKGGFQAVWKERRELVDSAPPTPTEDEDEQDMRTDAAGGPPAQAILHTKHLPMSAFAASSTTAAGNNTNTNNNNNNNPANPQQPHSPSRGGGGGVGVSSATGTSRLANMPKPMPTLPLPPPRPAFNPFFDTIRQNVELSHGITERIPLHLPRRVRARINELPFGWLQDIARRAAPRTHHPGSASASPAPSSASSSSSPSPRPHTRSYPSSTSTTSTSTNSTSSTTSTPSSSTSSSPLRTPSPSAIEEGTEALAMQFYRIELAEQRRLMGVMEHHSKESGGVVGEGVSRAAMSFPFSITAGVEKGAKNRYRYIWPFEHARVRLSHLQPQSQSPHRFHGHGKHQHHQHQQHQQHNQQSQSQQQQQQTSLEDDYVNASYVQPLGTTRRYIATQGPLEATFVDFWTLCWEQNVHVIVMLTREVEGAMVKCGAYWTEEAYGPLRLRLVDVVGREGSTPDEVQPKKEEVMGGFFEIPVDVEGGSASSNADADAEKDKEKEKESKKKRSDKRRGKNAIIKRTFELRHTGYPRAGARTITHLQYLEWPDMNVPDDPRGVLKMIEEVDRAVGERKGELGVGEEEEGLVGVGKKGRRGRGGRVAATSGSGSDAESTHAHGKITTSPCSTFSSSDEGEPAPALPIPHADEMEMDPRCGIAKHALGIAHRPVLLHCSAGVGRTGGFIAVDAVLDAVRREMRRRRKGNAVGDAGEGSVAGSVGSGVRSGSAGLGSVDASAEVGGSLSGKGSAENVGGGSGSGSGSAAGGESGSAMRSGGGSGSSRSVCQSGFGSAQADRGGSAYAAEEDQEQEQEREDINALPTGPSSRSPLVSPMDVDGADIDPMSRVGTAVPATTLANPTTATPTKSTLNVNPNVAAATASLTRTVSAGSAGKDATDAEGMMGSGRVVPISVTAGGRHSRLGDEEGREGRHGHRAHHREHYHHHEKRVVHVPFAGWDDAGDAGGQGASVGGVETSGAGGVAGIGAADIAELLRTPMQMKRRIEMEMDVRDEEAGMVGKEGWPARWAELVSDSTAGDVGGRGESEGMDVDSNDTTDSGNDNSSNGGGNGAGINASFASGLEVGAGVGHTARLGSPPESTYSGPGSSSGDSFGFTRPRGDASSSVTSLAPESSIMSGGSGSGRSKIGWGGRSVGGSSVGSGSVGSGGAVVMGGDGGSRSMSPAQGKISGRVRFASSVDGTRALTGFRIVERTGSSEESSDSIGSGGHAAALAHTHSHSSVHPQPVQKAARVAAGAAIGKRSSLLINSAGKEGGSAHVGTGDASSGSSGSAHARTGYSSGRGSSLSGNASGSQSPLSHDSSDEQGKRVSGQVSTRAARPMSLGALPSPSIRALTPWQASEQQRPTSSLVGPGKAWLGEGRQAAASPMAIPKGGSTQHLTPSTDALSNAEGPGRSMSPSSCAPEGSTCDTGMEKGGNGSRGGCTSEYASERPRSTSAVADVRTTRVDYKEPRPLHEDFSPPPLSTYEEPIWQVVQDMREQRMSLCQSLRQYVFVHAAVIEGALMIVDKERDRQKRKRRGKSDAGSSVSGNGSRSGQSSEAGSGVVPSVSMVPADARDMVRNAAKQQQLLPPKGFYGVSAGSLTGKRTASPTELLMEDSTGHQLLSKRPSMNYKKSNDELGAGKQTAALFKPGASGLDYISRYDTGATR